MARTLYLVILADVLLLVALLLVEQDLAWRSAYASSLHGACPQQCRYSPSMSYSFLAQFFTMGGNGVSLTSPATLDWVQLLTYVLVIVNGWYLYGVLRARRGPPPPAS
jgi:hypothetical protein